MIDRSRRIHFIGIGGIGMSGLAQICVGQGLAVSGCDAKASCAFRQLEELGVLVDVGHDPQHLDQDVGLVIWSGPRGSARAA